MEIHELDVEIAPNGQVKVHVKGAKGPACLDYVRWLEEVLGRASEVRHTGEFYEPPTDVTIRLEQKEST